MSNLAKEVADELHKRFPDGNTPPQLSWLQRASLIVAANVFGLVLGAIVIAAGSIVWQKAMSTDDLKEQIEDSDKLAKAERQAILDELANLGAEHVRFRQIVLNYHPDQDHAAPPEEGETAGREPASEDPATPEALPETGEDPMQVQAPPQAIIVEPSAADLREAKESLQKRIDEKVYRAKHLRD